MIRSIKNKLPTLIHIVVWAILYHLHVYFLQNFMPLQLAFLHAGIYLSYLAGIFYLHSNLLLPRFFSKRKIGYYLISLAVLMLISKLANDGYMQFFREDFAALDVPHSPHGEFNPLFSGTFPVILASFVVWFITRYRQREQQHRELKAQKTAAELDMLKSQINPHFLFNTLNNIYALSLEKAEPVISEMIMSLSEINRYMLYETGTEYVPLHKETAYLKSYIELEKLRIENRSNIQVDLGTSNDVKVAPLLLIPFVENAFKHSRIVDEPNAWIHISLEVTQNKLLFSCSNSVPRAAFQKDKTHGIGLENVQKRLLLLYPDQYHLTIDEENQSFVVKLTLHL